jgi:hypothetical protein
MSKLLYKLFLGSSACFALFVFCEFAAAREREPTTAKVIVQAGAPGCRVDLDAQTVGTTDGAGNLTIVGVDPSDHYLHVRCQDKPEAAYFISPKANTETRISPIQVASPSSPESADIARAESKPKLEKLVQQAVQLRTQGRLDEAVAALREAMKMDPENSDLHREMGITFLLAKQWKRARVEMIEAIRHDQNDADAHNGLGYALEKLGNLDGAAKEYRIATNLEPDDPSYHTHYVDALVKIQAREATKKRSVGSD